MSGITGGLNTRGSGLVNLGSAADGNIFTGTGAGLPVGFEAPAGGGGWAFVSSVTASDSASVAFTNMVDGYDYQYVFENFLNATDNVELDMQVGISGPTYRTSSYDSSCVIIYTGNQSYGREFTDAFSAGLDNSIGNAAGEGVRGGQVTFTNPASASITTAMYGLVHTIDSASNTSPFTVVGWYTSAEAHTAIRFLFHSGNIASGSIHQYRRSQS